MKYTRQRAVAAARELVYRLRVLAATGARLGWCRLRGGHEMGTWRAEEVSYPHTWCQRCGWCEQQQSFEEEDEWRAHPEWPETTPKESAGSTPH